MSHDRNAARRVFAGHVSNLYAGVIDLEGCTANLLGLSEYGLAQGDDELAQMAAEFAGQLAEGNLPTLVLPELGLAVGPDPDAPAPELDVAQIANAAAVQEQERAAAQEREAARAAGREGRGPSEDQADGFGGSAQAPEPEPPATSPEEPTA